MALGPVLAPEPEPALALATTQVFVLTVAVWSDNDVLDFAGATLHSCLDLWHDMQPSKTKSPSAQPMLSSEQRQDPTSFWAYVFVCTVL